MDISHSKADKAAKEPGAETPAPEGASPETATRNPATFVPQGGGGAISIDKKLLVKFGAIALAAILVIVIGLWALFGRSSSPKPSANPAELWVKAAPGEPSFSLVAKGTVNVTVVTAKEGNTIYQGTIPLGDIRTIPRKVALKVTADPHQNLEFDFGGKRYPMPNQRTADIQAAP